MKSNPVVHFEMPYENSERLSKFYSEVFGWQMQQMGSDMSDYVLAGTTETDENQMIKTPGNINGGFFPKSQAPQAGTSVVIAVDDIKDAMKKITDAGGKIDGEPMEIPGIGQWVVFNDTEGNRVSILQPIAM
ncbi:MAG TPA: VOC family protein [Chitinophagales bacterium]|nr:VOC family protein [Chitinophagales bacterium]